MIFFFFKKKGKYFYPNFHHLHRGAVAVSMDIRMLDIDQCPDRYWVPNAFKDTHKCDDKTSYVSHFSKVMLDAIDYFRYTFSACLFWDADSRRVDTSVNANKVTSILSKTPLPT